MSCSVRNALPAANFVTVNDQEIKVVVPGSQKEGLTPMQVNAFFNGQTLPPNNDVEVDIRPRYGICSFGVQETLTDKSSRAIRQRRPRSGTAP